MTAFETYAKQRRLDLSTDANGRYLWNSTALAAEAFEAGARSAEADRADNYWFVSAEGKRVGIPESAGMAALAAGVQVFFHGLGNAKGQFIGPNPYSEAIRADNLRDAGPAPFGGRNAGLKRD